MLPAGAIDGEDISAGPQKQQHKVGLNKLDWLTPQDL